MTAPAGWITIPVMRVLELTNISRRKTPLLYRRTYTATAVLAHGPTGRSSGRVEFVLEHSPLGAVDIRVHFLDEIDCPILPAVTALRAHIARLEQNGELP